VIEQEKILGKKIKKKYKNREKAID